jgi:hypothetical protein
MRELRRSGSLPSANAVEERRAFNRVPLAVYGSVTRNVAAGISSSAEEGTNVWIPKPGRLAIATSSLCMVNAVGEKISELERLSAPLGVNPAWRSAVPQTAGVTVKNSIRK